MDARIIAGMRLPEIAELLTRGAASALLTDTPATLTCQNEEQAAVLALVARRRFVTLVAEADGCVVRMRRIDVWRDVAPSHLNVAENDPGSNGKGAEAE